MILVLVRTLTAADGRSAVRKVFARAAGESVGPLDVLPPRVPPLKAGWARTRQRVRVNRSGTWAVWSATDVRA